MHRPRARAHLEHGAREEAAPRERAALEVLEERFAHGDELGTPAGAASAGSMTSAWKIRSASSTVASWSSCLEPKCA